MILSEENNRSKAGKMLMYLYIISVVMIFAGLTSAYIVRRAEGNWRYFDLPTIFQVSTLLILASSLTHHLALVAAKKNQFNKISIYLIITLVLGIGFAFSQVIGWQQLINIKVHLVGNPSESFIYILTGMHLVHMIGALVFLTIVTIQSLKYYFHKDNYYLLDLCAKFWHFLDILWVYLFFFLLIIR
jgi:cytochrome c oxidase subunit 3